jgi:hypothetical protein
MTALLDKLNLRPAERRLVVIVAIVVFVAINAMVVFPHFGDWGKANQRARDASEKLRLYQAEIAKVKTYEKQVRELEGQGQNVASEEQVVRFQGDVNSLALLTQVQIESITSPTRSPTVRSNAFFEEQTITLTANTGEKELVDFLWRLADQESLTRVRSMQLAPEPQRFRLKTTLTLVKSYQRKQPAKPAAAKPATTAAKPAATAAKPAAAPATPKPAAPSTPAAQPTNTSKRAPRALITPPGSGAAPVPAPAPMKTK